MSQITDIKEKLSQISEILESSNGCEIYDDYGGCIEILKVYEKPLLAIAVDEEEVWLTEKATNDIINKLQELRNEIWGVK